jgi:hypothetical protein
VGHIIEDAQTMMQTFMYCVINYISCEANFAHNLAKLVAQSDFEREWKDESPDCILEIIQVEQITLSH